MEQRKLSNTASSRIVDEYPEAAPGPDFKGLALLVGVVIGGGVIVVLFIMGHATIQTIAGPVMAVVLWSCALAVPVGGITILGGRQYRMIKEESRKDRRFRPNANGGYDALLKKDESGFLEPKPGTPMQVTPHTVNYAPHLAVRNNQEYLPPGKQDLEQEGQSEAIPAIVRYEDIADEVPFGMDLLGVHPSNGNLELIDYEKLKMLLIIGVASTGKSMTVYGKALGAVQRGAKLIIVDQHANKEDSLTRKLSPLQQAFRKPVAVTDAEVEAAYDLFCAEFQRRVSCPLCAASAMPCHACSQPWVLIHDETSRAARNERLVKKLKEVVAVCGEEARGFGMFGWFLSPRVTGMKWLRDAALTVICHRLTTFEEAKLACNNNTAAARNLINFQRGRTYVYGVDIEEPLELQQPLYRVVEQPLTVDTFATESLSSDMSSSKQATLRLEDIPEDNGEADGRDRKTETIDFSSELKKILSEAGRLRAKGESVDAILKQFGLTPGGRNNQNMQALLDNIETEVSPSEAPDEGWQYRAERSNHHAL